MRANEGLEVEWSVEPDMWEGGRLEGRLGCCPEKSIVGLDLKKGHGTRRVSTENSPK